MVNRLNILNGDATLEKFAPSGLPGDVLVWREILSEGPVLAGPAAELFKLRASWLHEDFNAPKDDYRIKVVQEFDKLQGYGQYDEVLLWFEFDLCDQINLIFLLNFFYANNKSVPLYLISPSEFPGYPNFKGIGELMPQELVQLTEQQFRLTDYDLKIAAEAWRVYTTGDELTIRKFLQEDHGQLTLLKPALEAHLERFPDAAGLNRIDRELIRIVDSGVKDEWQIFKQFSDAWKIYGMTDLSVQSYLKKLKAAGHIQLP
ncbi:MAG TPA: DUF1835 domain-containing protein [Sphingobacteriaceae bacterium]